MIHVKINIPVFVFKRKINFKGESKTVVMLKLIRDQQPSSDHAHIDLQGAPGQRFDLGPLLNLTTHGSFIRLIGDIDRELIGNKSNDWCTKRSIDY